MPYIYPLFCVPFANPLVFFTQCDVCHLWVLTLELTDHCDHKTLLPQLQCAPFCLLAGTYWLENVFNCC